MLWIEVSVSTTSFGVDPVCARLDALDISDLVVEDERDFLRFLEENRKRWDFVDDQLYAYFKGRSVIRFYLPDEEGAAARIAAVEASLAELASLYPAGKLGSLECSTRKVEEDDWAENWKKYFKPLPIDTRLVICPEWERIEDYPEYAGREVLRINPGMLFGSGTHETTTLCLSEIGQRVRRDDLVLDLGCGSGILAIASLLFGAREAVACDIDPAAEKIVAENAALNGLGGDRLPVLVGDVTVESAVRRQLFSRKYDLVLSNIVADVLISLCPHIPDLLAEGAVWITSGIIDTRLADVLAAAKAAGLEPVNVRTAAGWCCAIFRRV